MPVNFRGAEGVSIINSPINDIFGDNNIQNAFPDAADHSESEPKTETENNVRDASNDGVDSGGMNTKPEADTAIFADTYSLSGQSGSTSTAPCSRLFHKWNQKKSKQSRSQNAAAQPAK